MNAAYIAEHGDAGYPPSYLMLFTDQTIGAGGQVANPDAEDMQFQIEYIPVIETNIYTYRERKTDFLEEITSQTYNQQANVVSSGVLGELVDKVSKSNSGNDQKYSFIHKDASELLTIGKRAGDYVITSAAQSINYNTIISNYNLDQYFVKLNTYVAVLEKWRQFSIPNENIVRRQMTINKFIKFEEGPVTYTSAELYRNMYLSSEEMKAFRLTPTPQLGGLFIQATSFPFNNSLIFEGTIEGNAHAGNKSVYLAADKRIEEPVIYTDINGRLVGPWYATLSKGFEPNMDINNSHNLPSMQVNNLLSNDILYQGTLVMNKDAREQLSISLQMHHVDTTGKVYINAALAAYNGLVGGLGLTTNTKLLYLNEKPYYKEVVDSNSVLQATTAAMSLTLTETSIILPRAVNTSGVTSAAVAYAKDLGGGKYEILYWVNEEIANGASNTQLYLNFDKEY